MEPERVDLPIVTHAAATTPAERLPRWLKRPLPLGNANHFTARLLDELRLETVCDSARCPNRMECYSQKTATFMILGAVCTRPCGFCAVAKGRTEAVAEDEPDRLAEASARLGLRHVVITSVTRDDLPDGGAEHFHRAVIAVRRRTGAAVEVLTPDFAENVPALERVLDAAPEVFNHNTETVPRLYRRVRGRKSRYAWTLELLRRARCRADQFTSAELARAGRHAPATADSAGAGQAKMLVKSGLMLGLGETRDELLETLADLRSVGVDCLTLGQYLRPSPEHLSVVRYLPPEEFDELGRLARHLGFRQVASGPFVRSSYHARDLAAGLQPTAHTAMPAGLAIAATEAHGT